MKSKQFKIDGITYTAHSSTDSGLKEAIKMMRKAVKKNKKDKE